MGFEKTDMLQLARLKKAGALTGGRPPPPPLCKDNARDVVFKNSYVLKKAQGEGCFEASLHGVNKGSGWGQICNHNARMMGLRRLICFEASLHSCKMWGGWRGAAHPFANTMLA